MQNENTNGSMDTSPKDGPRIEVKQPPVLFEETQALLDELESALKAPVLTYWTPPNGSISQTSVVAMHEMLQRIGNVDTLYLFVKSSGGCGKSALRMVNVMRQYAKRVVALVPLECVSAGTMLVLGADEIQMGPLAWLSPVDTSLTHDLSPIDRDNDRVSVSLDELKRVVRLHNQESKESHGNPYSALFDHVHPLVIGAVDRADSLSTLLCYEILSFHINEEEKARRIAKVLNEDYPSHSYPILLKHAQKIGINALPLENAANKILVRLGSIYSEMTQSAVTDFDDVNQHSNEICSIFEAQGKMIYFQLDKDWHYRSEERRWVSLNDESSWFRREFIGGELKTQRFYIR